MLSQLICRCATLQLVLCLSVAAQTPLLIYRDALSSGWQDWSWGTRDLANTSPVYAGPRSVSASLQYWQAISFWHSPINTTLYTNLSFWVNGGSGGQRLQIVGVTDTGDAVYTLPFALPAGSWTNILVPLSSFGAANRTNFQRFHIQLRNTGTANTFYLDEVQFTPQPYPSMVEVLINPLQTVRKTEPRHFGVNTAIWDSHFDSSQTIAVLREMGSRVLRFPGGSLSDEYHWASNTSSSNTWQWVTSFAKFVKVATNIGAQAFITVNYGSGTPQEAAAWVRHANVTNRLAFKYWEIGNENYGTWEHDTNALKNHAFTYATRAKLYLGQMKAADPTIKVGVVAAPGENSFQNGYTDHPTLNPRTGATNYGWTPILLKTLKNLGVKPDFLVHHHYPQWTDSANPTGAVNDETLLQSAGNWELDAADLRRQIQDYYGAGGEDIELVVTENNSDAGAQGRQSTSLVNGLYYAESLGRLLQTEFNAFVWWDLRNGTDTKGDFSETLYGWRSYGDLGMINGPGTKHPTFFAAKLFSTFASPGSEVLHAASEFPLLSAFAARSTNNSLSVLVINKDKTASIQGRVEWPGFIAQTQAITRFYGIPQDEAARTNAPAPKQDISTNALACSTTSLTNAFPPLSLTLLSLTPASQPTLSFQVEAGVLSLVIPTQHGINYRVQVATNVTAGQWSELANLHGTGAQLRHVLTNTGIAQFFRVVLN